MVSLYRKWRSRSFDDLVGQEHVVRTLRNAVRQRRIAHAYLFTGPRGTGKTSTARILAKAINCLRPQDGNPCDMCEMCLASNEGRAMDVIEIDAASNTSVDNVRELRERVAYAAGEGQYKVYIVDEVHRLSGAAFDAFLKTLEEPPPHVVFVFASTEPHKVPETITSRCQRFDFRRISSRDTLARMRYVVEQEKLDATDEALRLVALHARGSLRDALGLLDQVAAYTGAQIDDFSVRRALGIADATLIGELTNDLIRQEVGAGLARLQTFVDDGGDTRQLIRQMIDYWRAILLTVSGMPIGDIVVDPALSQYLPQHARQLTVEQIMAMLRSLTEQEFGSRFNVPAQLPFEMGFVQAALHLRGTNAVTSGALLTARVESARHEIAEDRGVERQVSNESVPKPPPMVESSDGRTPADGQGTPQRPQVSATPTDVDGAWPDVLAAIGRRNKMLQAILRSGYVMKAQEGEITIGFLHEFHRNQLADTKKRKILEEIVSEVMRASYRVTCVRATAQEIEALRGAGAVQADDGFVEEVAERLREFHVRELGNGHS